MSDETNRVERLITARHRKKEKPASSPRSIVVETFDVRSLQLFRILQDLHARLGADLVVLIAAEYRVFTRIAEFGVADLEISSSTIAVNVYTIVVLERHIILKPGDLGLGRAEYVAAYF